MSGGRGGCSATRQKQNPPLPLSISQVWKQFIVEVAPDLSLHTELEEALYVQQQTRSYSLKTKTKKANTTSNLGYQIRIIFVSKKTAHKER